MGGAPVDVTDCLYQTVGEGMCSFKLHTTWGIPALSVFD